MKMDYTLELYRQMFTSLKRGNSCGSVSNAKPVYLMTLIEIIPALKDNLVRIDNPVLKECYQTNTKLFQRDKKTQLSVPYFHLRTAPFYEILWRDGKLPAATPSAKFLKEHTLGARLDDDLWNLLQEPANREYLRGCIIKQYLTD